MTVSQICHCPSSVGRASLKCVWKNASDVMNVITSFRQPKLSHKPCTVISNAQHVDNKLVCLKPAADNSNG